jgi:hypothetical protein
MRHLSMFSLNCKRQTVTIFITPAIETVSGQEGISQRILMSPFTLLPLVCDRLLKDSWAAIVTLKSITFYTARDKGCVFRQDTFGNGHSVENGTIEAKKFETSRAIYLRTKSKQQRSESY